ncbi:hypothetical protein [Bradyrhizobium sp. CCBAU 51745]|uniref:hypothetical protein n=1 Tax=Bradyrhizobium sp. CCBAU 51745 TaxID=1325099 RepID=UPI002306B3B7|nr:hypothetical protein [Bradyrhizobium sp. CCBAU 51745]
MEIIVLARLDRKRSAAFLHPSPARYFDDSGSAQRKHIDIMDFSTRGSLLTLHYI